MIREKAEKLRREYMFGDNAEEKLRREYVVGDNAEEKLRANICLEIMPKKTFANI